MEEFHIKNIKIKLRLNLFQTPTSNIKDNVKILQYFDIIFKRTIRIDFNSTILKIYFGLIF